jgi:membrane protein
MRYVTLRRARSSCAATLHDNCERQLGRQKEADMSSHGPLNKWWALIKSAVAAWVEDYAPSMGAALSYYTIFSLGPVLLIVISVAGLIFGPEAARGEIFAQLRGLMGADAAKTIEDVLTSVNKPTAGMTASVIGLVLLFIGATTVFGELQDALDRIWRAPARDKTGGIWSLLRSRLLSFGLILGIAFLLIVSLVLSAATAALGKWWSGAFAGWEVLLQLVNMVVSYLVTTLAFAMIYKIMPRVKVRWHDVWLGAAVTALLFTIGKFLIGLYIGKSGIASGFGAAGSVIIILVWVYYSAQIFLLGAEFTWVYARTFGSMRGIDTSTNPDDAVAPTIPTRSDDGETGDPVPIVAFGPAPVNPRPLWIDLGAGAAFLLTLNYIVTRILKRR